MEIMSDMGVAYASFARHKNVSCISHLHTSFEIVCVTKGCVRMIVDGEARSIPRGYASVIMPMQTHSFLEGGDTECLVFVFSGDLVESFSELIRNRYPKKPVFILDESSFEYVNRKFPEDGESDTLIIQSVLLPLCREIYEKCDFMTGNDRCDSVFIKAVEYTAENFTEISGLSDAARYLNVSSAYLSRVFRQNSQHDYTHYLNTLKSSYAARLLINRYPEFNISEIAFSSGFGSIRSFNRVFSEVFRMTPKEYIKQKKLFSL